jgi:hypothetical protein
MPSNHLEDLVAEWYQFRDYFVRRNISVNPRKKGGFETELDIVAFNPESRRLVHLEPSLDAYSWRKREERYKRKFEAGKKHIPKIFNLDPHEHPIEQFAILGFCGRNKRKHKQDTIGGGQIKHVSALLAEIFEEIKERKLASKAISEQFPLLRTLQYVAEYWDDISSVMKPKQSLEKKIAFPSRSLGTSSISTGLE